MSKSNTVLNSTERSDAQFLTSLATALSNYDLSGKNFRKFGPHLFSLMIDNYQIQVAQTGVFYYPTRFHKFLGNDKYAFEPGKYERYEVCVYENRYPMHRLDCDELLLGTPVDDGDVWVWRGNSNTLFMNAAMATDIGRYRTSCFDGRPEQMFSRQNAHLFSPAKHLYHILGDQAAKVTNEKIIDKTPYDIQPVLDKYEIAAHREQLLHKVKDKIFHRQK